MRGYLTAIATLVSALPAAASSIDTITTPVTGGNSITTISCSACPPLQDVGRTTTYVVPQISSGTDRTELTTIHGRKKLVRTEAWLGGSPVNVVSDATDSALRMARASGNIPAVPLDVRASSAPVKPVFAEAVAQVMMGVDTQMTTAALGAPMTAAMMPIATGKPPSRDFDGQSFELRLD